MNPRFVPVMHRIDWADGTASTSPAVLDTESRMVARFFTGSHDWTRREAKNLNAAPHLASGLIWRPADTDGGSILDGEQ